MPGTTTHTADAPEQAGTSRSPRVSVVMSVYNGGAFLDAAVRSILGQTFGSFEFIIINDGSRDGSAEVLVAFAAADPRIRLVHQENAGLVSALNRGIAMARAALIARMDADDIAVPDRLERQVAFLDAHPEIGVLGGTIALIDDRDAFIRDGTYPTAPEAVRAGMRNGSQLAHPTVMMRTGLVRAAGGYRAAYRHAEDYDLWLRLLESTEIANLPDTLLRYRIHDDKVSSRHAIAQREATIVAQHVAALRAQGLADPTDGFDTLSPEFYKAFRRIGGDRAFARLMVDLQAVIIVRALGAGDFSQLQELLRTMAEHLPEGYDRELTISHLVRGALGCLRNGRLRQAAGLAFWLARTFPVDTVRLSAEYSYRQLRRRAIAALDHVGLAGLLRRALSGQEPKV